MSACVPLPTGGFSSPDFDWRHTVGGNRVLVSEVYPACHSFLSSLSVYVCLRSSFSRHASWCISLLIWPPRPSIHLPPLSAGLSDWSLGGFKNPEVLAGSFEFLPLFIMCSGTENLLCCSQVTLHQQLANQIVSFLCILFISYVMVNPVYVHWTQKWIFQALCMVLENKEFPFVQYF